MHEIYEVPARQLAVGARLEATHVVWNEVGVFVQPLVSRLCRYIWDQLQQFLFIIEIVMDIEQRFILKGNYGIWGSARTASLPEGWALTCVILAEELHAHHGENEDDNTQDEGQVTQGANGLTHDGNEEIECRPRLRQFEDTKLERGEEEGYRKNSCGEVQIFLHICSIQ